LFIDISSEFEINIFNVVIFLYNTMFLWIFVTLQHVMFVNGDVGTHRHKIQSNNSIPSQNLGHVQPHFSAWLSAAALCPALWLHQGAVTPKLKISRNNAANVCSLKNHRLIPAHASA
jgi:hypothetical protein